MPTTANAASKTAATSRLHTRLSLLWSPGGLILGDLLGLPADQTQSSHVYPPISKGSEKSHQPDWVW